MNFKTKILILSATLFMSFSISAKANNIEFGIFGGLSVPNSQVSNFFNSDSVSAKIDSLEGIGNFIVDAATDIGYHIGVKARFGLSDRFWLVAGVAYHRFNSGKYQVAVQDTVEKNKMDTASVRATPSLIPISAGINGYLLHSNFISVYATGDLSYNIMNTSVKVTEWATVDALSISDSETASRLGAGLGAGIDFDIKILTLNLEAKYNWMNIVGKDNDENSKNFVTVSLGVIF